MNEIYLKSDILVGYNDGSTWLLTDHTVESDPTQPDATVFVISACNPRSEMQDPTENLYPSLALEADLKNLGFKPTLGWGANQEGTIHELSFCVQVDHFEYLQLVRDQLLKLARVYNQNAIFEVDGRTVSVLSTKPGDKSPNIIKSAVKLAESQSNLREKLEALSWLVNLDEEAWCIGQELINKRLGELNV